MARTTITLGDLTIHRIVEQEGPFMPAQAFLTGLSDDVLAANRAWLQPHALDADDQLIMCMQSYVVRTPHHIILVDTCVGNDKHRPNRPTWHMRSDDTYMRNLAAHGLRVEDIDFVMCTHLHPDHVGWNTKLLDGRWVPTFPNARYVFSKNEHTFWAAQHALKPSPLYQDSVLPIIEAQRADLVADDFALGDHTRLLPTPGHTADHFAVLFGRGRDLAAMTGDLIHTPLQARYPDLSCTFDIDPAQSARTRHAFLDRFCDSQTLCCTSHFPSPSVAKISRWGSGFACTPVE